MATIDLNCDLGEGYGSFAMGDDAGMLDIVSTVNLACGFHAGDPVIMGRICAGAKTRGVAVGAHPGYPDLWGFGRRHMNFSPRDLQQLVAYQLGAAAGVAMLAGHAMTHVKAHGALGHLVADQSDACEAFAAAVRAVDPSLALCVMAGTRLETVGERAGLRVVREIYADRAYQDDGRLLSRGQPGAVIHDPHESARRVLAMVEEGAIITAAGSRIPTAIDTVCVHGDTAQAVPIARHIRAVLEHAGHSIRPFAGRDATCRARP